MISRKVNYENLLHLSKTPTDKTDKHFINREMSRNFLEMCLVINKARTGTLLPLDPGNIDAIRSVLYEYNTSEPIPVTVRPFNVAKNQYFITQQSSKMARDVEAVERVKDNVRPMNHVGIGSILGYMTTINIGKSRVASSSKDYSAQITCTFIYYGMDIHNVQLAPQIIVGKTHDEIAKYYEPMLRTLTELNTWLPNGKVTDIKLIISDHPPIKEAKAAVKNSASAAGNASAAGTAATAATAATARNARTARRGRSNRKRHTRVAK